MSTTAQVISRARQASATPQLARRAIRLRDLTSLDDGGTPENIATLCQRAITPAGPVAAVCIYPHFVTQCYQTLAGSGVKVATVVNFPTGDADADSVCNDTAEALEACATMLQAIREQAGDAGTGHRTIGLKPSGGIRDSDEAARYVALADIIMGDGWATPNTFRFGVSSLLDALLKTLGQDVDTMAKTRY